MQTRSQLAVSHYRNLIRPLKTPNVTNTHFQTHHVSTYEMMRAMTSSYSRRTRTRSQSPELDSDSDAGYASSTDIRFIGRVTLRVAGPPERESQPATNSRAGSSVIGTGGRTAATSATPRRLEDKIRASVSTTSTTSTRAVQNQPTPKTTGSSKRESRSPPQGRPSKAKTAAKAKSRRDNPTHTASREKKGLARLLTTMKEFDF
ncbi:hypothetical protein HYDPIDRAFT_190714 [Hydnomerulius pinastri MD-312]|uniref:Unplaced genomic scaffold scaffold_75, whole genome shotgun sequence n=1 Tax=Hydnomerulius pinastri MD-312 TaxID=994086 RepID=A0A0C9V0P7_9AGAM|nr:hypothetical protein HYDPIDRAFT_190714 [Hydnomerulius pinastri MD-312]